MGSGPEEEEPHSLPLQEELQSLGCGTRVKSSWPGRCWLRAEAAEPRPVGRPCKGGQGPGESCRPGSEARVADGMGRV